MNFLKEVWAYKFLVKTLERNPESVFSFLSSLDFGTFSVGKAHTAEKKGN